MFDLSHVWNVRRSLSDPLKKAINVKIRHWQNLFLIHSRGYRIWSCDEIENGAKEQDQKSVIFDFSKHVILNNHFTFAIWKKRRLNSITNNILTSKKVISNNPQEFNHVFKLSNRISFVENDKTKKHFNFETYGIVGTYKIRYLEFSLLSHER